MLVDSGLLGAAKEDLRPARQPHGQPRQPQHSAAVAAAITALAALATASAVILKYFAIKIFILTNTYLFSGIRIFIKFHFEYFSL